MESGRREIVLRAWRKLWRKASRSTKGSDPEGAWGKFRAHLKSDGVLLAKHVFALWADAAVGGGTGFQPVMDATGKMPVPQAADDRKFLEEVIASISPPDALIRGWLDAWALKHSEPEAVRALHDLFADNRDFWRLLDVALTRGHTAADPPSRGRRSPASAGVGGLRKMFSDLGGDYLFRYYYRYPGRAALLAGVLADDDLELLHVAGASSITEWTEQIASETVLQCFGRLKALNYPPPPISMEQLGALNEFVANAWVACLAKHRVEYAFEIGQEEAWQLVPCTYSPPWAGAYNKALVKATADVLGRDPSQLKQLSPYMTKVLLATSGWPRRVIVHALLVGLGQEAIAWEELAGEVRDAITQSVQQDTSGKVLEAASELHLKEEVEAKALPKELRAVLITTAVRAAEAGPELDEKSAAILVQMIQGEPPRGLMGEQDVAQAPSPVASPTQPRAAVPPAAPGLVDWSWLAFDFDPSAPDSYSLLPSSPTGATILTSAKLIFARWRQPESGQVTPQKAIADIASWDRGLLGERAVLLAHVLEPLFEEQSVRTTALEQAWANEAAADAIATVADGCLAAGHVAPAGVVAAASRTPQQLLGYLRRTLEAGTGSAAEGAAAEALKLWCGGGREPDDFDVLLDGVRELAGSVTTPEVLRRLGVADVLLRLAVKRCADAERVRERTAAVCRVFGLNPDEADGALLAAVNVWLADAEDGEALASLWPILVGMVEAGHWAPDDEQVQPLICRTFEQAARRLGQPGQIIGQASKLTAVFGLSTEDAMACLSAAVAEWLKASPTTADVSALLQDLAGVFPEPLDEPTADALQALRGMILDALGEQDFWTVLEIAAEQEIGWESLPGDPDARLRQLLGEAAIDDVWERVAAMKGGSVRTRAISEFCRAAPPSLYEEICLRQSYCPSDEADEWRRLFRQVKVDLLREKAQAAAPQEGGEGPHAELDAQRDILEALSWQDSLDYVGPDLCAALAAGLSDVRQGRAASANTVPAEDELRLADLLFLVWSKNWAEADSREDAEAWAGVWRDGFGEVVTHVFARSEHADAAERERRVFAADVVEQLLGHEGPAKDALADVLGTYRSWVHGLGFGAPVYAADVEALLGASLRNYRVSILRRVVEGHTRLDLGDFPKHLLQQCCQQTFYETNSACSLIAEGPDPLRAQLFLPGDSHRPGQGLADIAAERGAGLPEELAVVLLLRAWNDGALTDRDSALALVRDILSLDLDLANAAVGSLLRRLLDRTFQELVPHKWHKLAWHLLRLRWRTGFGARADERDAAFAAGDPEGLDGEERSWALCARLTALAYSVFESQFSQDRADRLERVMLQCQAWLPNTGDGIAGLLLRHVAIRAGLEAIAWMSPNSDFSALRECIEAAHQNPFLRREDFEGHLAALAGAARGVRAGCTFVLWRGYSDSPDPDESDSQGAKLAESVNFGTTILLKARDHKWRRRLVKYHVRPYGSDTREISVARLHLYKHYLKHIQPHMWVSRHLLHVDTVAPLHLFGLPANDMPSKASGFVDLGTGDRIAEVSAWQMPSVVMEHIQGQSLVDVFCELTQTADTNARLNIKTLWPDLQIERLLTGEAAFGRILRWCEHFWGMQRAKLLDVADQLGRLTKAMALGSVVSVDLSPEHVLVCKTPSGEGHPVLIDSDALCHPDTCVTILNRAIEQSPYREPQYSHFLAATRQFGQMPPLLLPSERVAFGFTPHANYFVANLILYEFLAMTPGLQAAPVDVPDFISGEKRRIMDDILNDGADHPGEEQAGSPPWPTRSIADVASEVLRDWPDLSAEPDVMAVLRQIGFPVDLLDVNQQVAYVERLVANAVDPPPKGNPSHPPWIHALVPFSWLGDLRDPSELRGYDMLYVVLRLLAEGVAEVDPQLVLGPGSRVPDRNDLEALQRFHRRCSRFYASLGRGGRQFWRRSRGRILDRKLFRGDEANAASLDDDIIVTFGLREHGPWRKGGGRELVVCNFALRFASVHESFLQNKLTDTPEWGETGPLAFHYEREPADPADTPRWGHIADVLSENVDLNRILLKRNLAPFLDDPARTSFALGPDPESVALGRQKDARTLTHRKVDAGWTRDLDLTPYLPTGEGGAVYVRMQTTPFVFRVAWGPGQDAGPR